METDGAYGEFLANSLSAVIASFPNTTILAESPHKEKQLPEEIRWRYLGLPWAKIQYAIAEWADGLVGQTVRENAALSAPLLAMCFPPAIQSMIGRLALAHDHTDPGHSAYPHFATQRTHYERDA